MLTLVSGSQSIDAVLLLVSSVRVYFVRSCCYEDYILVGPIANSVRVSQAERRTRTSSPPLDFSK